MSSAGVKILMQGNVQKPTAFLWVIKFVFLIFYTLGLLHWTDDKLTPALINRGEKETFYMRLIKRNIQRRADSDLLFFESVVFVIFVISLTIPEQGTRVSSYKSVHSSIIL